jgi:hypothetical protein
VTLWLFTGLLVGILLLWGWRRDRPARCGKCGFPFGPDSHRTYHAHFADERPENPLLKTPTEGEIGPWWP